MLRIIGGEFRSRRLQSPVGSDITRPMPARVKESVFNLLREWFDNANVLDLFAGVGTLGLEAVSRGANKVILIEQNPQTFQILTSNIETLGCNDRAMAVQADALSPVALASAPAPVDVIFVDPPYRLMQSQEDRERVFEQLTAARGILAERSIVVLRAPLPEKAIALEIEGFEGPESHTYGKEMQVHLYMPQR